VADPCIVGESGETDPNASLELGMGRRNPAVEYIDGDALAGGGVAVGLIEWQTSLVDSIEREGNGAGRVDRRRPGTAGFEWILTARSRERRRRARQARLRHLRASDQRDRRAKRGESRDCASPSGNARTHETAGLECRLTRT